jgi:hypothetical protein
MMSTATTSTEGEPAGDSRTGDAEHHPSAGKQKRQHSFEHCVERKRRQDRQQNEQRMPSNG